ncbi:MAG: F510_1955 family glycosylhydrolase [Acidimicrobiia bacterium]
MVFGLAVLVALPFLVWTGIRLAGRDSAPTFTTDDPGVSHVHGLGVNPADGSVYVATHYGTFRLTDDGKAKRVGESYQDTMGFTVAGPDRFLGSGHPDTEGFRRGQPPRLGLIESTDSGKDWRSLSLSGEVDFHALAAAHGRVYGWDSTSGRFMVSADQRTWETRSTRPLLSFAVDPTTPDHIVAAAPEAVLDSSDGGRTWRPVAAPPVMTLSWDRTGGLVGAQEDGTVHRSGDGGASWTRVGSLPGSPQALLATDKVLYAAAHDREGTTGIYRSVDAGRTWTLIYRDRP